jgi:hypothetical protein
MADVDGYLASCGPPFFSHELALEQLADHRILENLVCESNKLAQTVSACSEPDHEFTHLVMTGMHTVKDDTKQKQTQQTQHDSAEASIMDADLALVPVTRGKRGLCYDVDQVADTKLQDRLLKNRERADQSRKRKLETIRRHEKLLEELNKENARMKAINTALSNRIAEVEVALLRQGAVRNDAQSVS